MIVRSIYTVSTARKLRLVAVLYTVYYMMPRLQILYMYLKKIHKTRDRNRCNEMLFKRFIDLGPERVFSGLATCEVRSAFTSLDSEARELALRRVAAIHEKDLVAIERRDALFQRCDLRVENLGHHHATFVFLRVEKDASQGRRNEAVAFPWEDGQVGLHLMKWVPACVWLKSRVTVPMVKGPRHHWSCERTF